VEINVTENRQANKSETALMLVAGTGNEKLVKRFGC
jgi:hypothetical protein